MNTKQDLYWIASKVESDKTMDITLLPYDRQYGPIKAERIVIQNVPKNDDFFTPDVMAAEVGALVSLTLTIEGFE